jgi:hypothetical protein
MIMRVQAAVESMLFGGQRDYHFNVLQFPRNATRGPLGRSSLTFCLVP